nr:LytR C-terminal domain-containing protein [Propionicimonas sp.]
MRQVIRVLKTPVTLLILLAILGYGAYWGYQQVTFDTSRPATPCVPQDVGGTLTSDRVTVRVFNGGEKPRAAKDTRNVLLAWHYNVIAYNNSNDDVTAVTVIGNSAEDPEVRLVAQAFKNATTKGDGRVDHVVDVILPTKFEMLETVPTTLEVDGPVCLPPIAAGSASATPSASTSATPSTSPSKKK